MKKTEGVGEKCYWQEEEHTNEKLQNLQLSKNRLVKITLCAKWGMKNDGANNRYNQIEDSLLHYAKSLEFHTLNTGKLLTSVRQI